MSNDFDSITSSINQELARINENQIERNRKFDHCLDSYLDHLKRQIEQIDSTEQKNDHRNQIISSTFENVYDRIMTSSQVCLRKIKETCYEKKQFWDSLIKNNAESTDLELKKDFYQQKRDAEDRYEFAIQNQKTKKMPYDLLLGKLQQKNSLKDWQNNNKILEQQVTKGTKTMKEWNIGQENNSKPQLLKNYVDEESQYFINQFQPHDNTRGLYRATNTEAEGGSILNNFQYRR